MGGDIGRESQEMVESEEGIIYVGRGLDGRKASWDLAYATEPPEAIRQDAQVFRRRPFRLDP